MALGGSFEILRQSGWDWWVWVCLAAAGVLVVHGIFTRPWRRAGGWPVTILMAFGAVGTLVVAFTPALHEAAIGMLWTAAIMCLLSTTVYLNLRQQLGTRRMLTLLGVRIIALAMLVPMLFEPVWRFVQQLPPRRGIAFLVDTSGSMSVPDVPNGPSRIQSVWQTLAPQLPKLREHFIPHFYTFSTRVTEIKNPDDLASINADGTATDFVSAINKAVADSSLEALEPIVLVSDGIDNVSPNAADLIAQTQRKISTLSVGSTLAEPSNLINVAVESVSSPPDVGVGHQAKLTATIKSSALANRVVDVKLSELDADGKSIGAVTSSRLVLQSTTDGQKVELAYTPPSAGVHRLAVWIDPIPGERNLADNRQEIQILADEQRIRVLYLEGAARPEFTYLNRLLGHDADVELGTLLRIQRDRFSASGTIDGAPLTALPRTDEEWAKFDCMIIGDLDASFLTTAQQTQIRQRISNGAGLLMIGGQKNFGAGGFQGTPMEEALPVYVGPMTSQQDMDEFVPQLTAEGAAHPIFDQLGEWFAQSGRRAAQTLSPLKGNVVVAGEKAGAQVLLIHPGKTGPDGKDQIVLAVEPYGKGRSAAFTADTTNIWYRQFREQGHASAYNRFWGQLIRWLAARDTHHSEHGAGMEAMLNKSVYQFGESMKARAIVRDEHGDATQFAQVTASLSGSGLSKPIPWPLPASAARVGEYSLVFPPTGEPGLRAGDYSLEVSAAKDGKPIGKQTIKFSVTPPEDEMLHIAANPKAMEEIAVRTGGNHHELSELPELLDELIAADPAAENKAIERTMPLDNVVRLAMAMAGKDAPWPEHSDLPMQGVIVISLLAGEWLLRRKWQLP